jgi:hypothetical protein
MVLDNKCDGVAGTISSSNDGADDTYAEMRQGTIHAL